MLQHAKLALELKGEQSVIELRKRLAWYCQGLPNAKELRTKLVQVKTLGDILTALSLYKP